MDWNPATVWWVAAGALVAAELTTGTFYLLMLALGAAAGAMAAHGGLASSSQMLAAALVGGIAVVGWHLRRDRLPAPAGSNPDVNLDIGQRVQVDTWTPDGRAQVHYRGAAWQARFVGTPPAPSGAYVIRALEGNCLLLDREA
ncbi:NfeD family protein [Roseateles cellulosilyticus]|uniref:NfeD family protein n=1 Tax=Pelomonas cellulosilytica TaxID=2906762 RepID=A0ABS8XTP8_9BURK|nr:NfeD family protein [Pelomonas sp. P8]MCE4556067.1 NfeD family protein [Pelomonas sp. P8]